MKTLKVIIIALLCAMPLFCSCEKDGTTEYGASQMNTKKSLNAKLEITSTSVYMTVKSIFILNGLDSGYDAIYDVKFSNDKCTSYIQTVKYNDSKNAKLAESAYNASGQPGTTYVSGATLTITKTAEYRGKSVDYISQELIDYVNTFSYSTLDVIDYRNDSN